VVRRKQISTTTNAAIGTVLLVIDVLAREGPLGALFLGYFILRGESLILATVLSLAGI
jgi:hypothetical protein